jgi:hypothetical protein
MNDVKILFNNIYNLWKEGKPSTKGNYPVRMITDMETKKTYYMTENDKFNEYFFKIFNTDKFILKNFSLKTFYEVLEKK